MENIYVEESDRPLYIGYGFLHRLELCFGGSTGDFSVIRKTVDLICKDLDDLGFPVDSISWTTQPYADHNVLCVSFDTGDRIIPEELINDMRTAVNVRCWGVGKGYIEEYYLEGKRLNTEVSIVLLDGRASSPDHSVLESERVEVTCQGNRYTFLTHNKGTSPEIDTVVVAEALGIYLPGGRLKAHSNRPL